MRQKIKLDLGWKFYKGDVLNGEEVKFDDAKWQDVDIPHDWSIEGPVSTENRCKSEFSWEQQFDWDGSQNGFFPMGIGWYRKKLQIPINKNDQKKKIFIEFEGAYRKADVWINGYFLGNRKSGYVTFKYDITDFVNSSKDNLMAVRLDARKKEGWWYEGCGIYRHVWLVVADKLRVDYWGTYVTTPEVGHRKSEVRVKTKVVNDYADSKNTMLITQIKDRNGKVVAETQSKQAMDKNSIYEFEQTLIVQNPQLWSDENPYLYKIITTVKDSIKTTDIYETPFGIRKFYFDADKGFFLNGKNVKLKGMCGHQDMVPLGAALPDRVNYHQMKLFKDCGCNLYRSSHNPPIPALLDACDELGIMVLDENRHMDDSPEKVQDLVDMIRRDRNHPCVILWGMENEEHREATIEGVKILKNLVNITHKEDPTRPTIYAANKDVNPCGYGDVTDVAGYNYFLFRANADHKNYPKRKIALMTEYSAAWGTQGCYDYSKIEKMYADHPERSKTRFAYNSMYEKCRADEICWLAIEERPWLAGGTLWNGFDYLGEAQFWPIVASQQGILDLCRFPKDNYYFYQSRWLKTPMVYIMPPHWNWAYGKTVEVWVYSNCDTVELFLNGKSLGVKSTPPLNSTGEVRDLWQDTAFHEEPISQGHITWRVPYEPGTLKAVAKNKGKIVSVNEIKTAGTAAKIVLTPRWETIDADGQDVCFINASVTDKNGVIVPNAENIITANVEGAGKFAAIGNADPCNHEFGKKNFMKTFNGVCLIVVKAGTKPGKIKITAASLGLEAGTATIESK